MKNSNISILPGTQFSHFISPTKLYNRYQTLSHKNLNLRTIQLVKCLSIIGFIGCVIGATLFPAIMCGSVAICAHLLKNRVSIKNVNDKEVRNENVFHRLLRLQLLSSKEDSSEITKYNKIALLLIAYSCVSQLVDSYRKEIPVVLENTEECYDNLEEYCSKKIQDINQNPNIKKIHNSITRLSENISIKKGVVGNVNVISETFFEHTPKDIMKMISELCDELAEEEKNIATKQVFEEDAKTAKTYAEKLTDNFTINSIRTSIRKSLLDNIAQNS